MESLKFNSFRTVSDNIERFQLSKLQTVCDKITISAFRMTLSVVSSKFYYIQFLLSFTSHIEQIEQLLVQSHFFPSI